MNELELYPLGGGEGEVKSTDSIMEKILESMYFVIVLLYENIVYQVDLT